MRTRSCVDLCHSRWWIVSSSRLRSCCPTGLVCVFAEDGGLGSKVGSDLAAQQPDMVIVGVVGTVEVEVGMVVVLAAVE